MPCGNSTCALGMASSSCTQSLTRPASSMWTASTSLFCVSRTGESSRQDLPTPGEHHPPSPSLSSPLPLPLFPPSFSLPPPSSITSSNVFPDPFLVPKLLPRLQHSCPSCFQKPFPNQGIVGNVFAFQLQFNQIALYAKKSEFPLQNTLKLAKLLLTTRFTSRTLKAFFSPFTPYNN